MALVYIPTPLAGLTGGKSPLQVEGATVREVIDNLERAWPGIRERLISEGRLRSNISVAVDGEVTPLGLGEPVSASSEVHFVAAISGGIIGSIETRTAAEADYDFLYDLHRRAFRSNVEATWGWDEEWQVRHFREHFNPARCEIIVCDGRDAGCLRVLDETDCIFVDYIAILPDYQNQGLGTRLLRDIQVRAAAKKIPVRLSVLTVNPARRLYERLGFRVVENDDVRYYLEAPATG